MTSATYKDAGVDLDALRRGDGPRCRGCCTARFSPRVLPLDGGFAGLFQLDFDSRLFARKYEDPVLVSCTDGVGTKLKVATLAGKHDTVGIDLVAMSVNDASAAGPSRCSSSTTWPCRTTTRTLLEQIVEGVSDGCVEADCALLGGETAIMPDIYARGDYDLAGFCVGVVERERIIDGRAIAPGDVVLGLASSGLHSNGYSLVRKIVFDIAGLAVDDHVAELGRPSATSCSSRRGSTCGRCASVLRHYPVKNGRPRHRPHHRRRPASTTWRAILPEGAQAVHPPRQLAGAAGLPLAAAAGRRRPTPRWTASSTWASAWCWSSAEYYADSIQHQLAECGLESWPIGEIRAGDKEVVLD